MSDPAVALQVLGSNVFPRCCIVVSASSSEDEMACSCCSPVSSILGVEPPPAAYSHVVTSVVQKYESDFWRT